MKKILMLIVLILITAINTAIAQDTLTIEDIKPDKGNFCFDFAFLPFSDDKLIQFTGLRGKYFIGPNLALRGTFNFDRVNNNHEEMKNWTFNDFDTTVANTYTINFDVWNAQLGVERRLPSNGSLAAYFGVDFGFGKKTSEYTTTEEEYYYDGEPYSIITSTTVENGWYGEDWEYRDNGGTKNRWYYVDQRAYNFLKVNIFAGMDIYIFRHLYLGFEVGLLMEYLKYKDATVWENGELQRKYYGYTDVNTMLNFTNSFRIGFWL
jgi:hypothetical protein